MLSLKEYQDFIEGYYVADCAVRSKEAFSFMLRQHSPEYTGETVRLEVRILNFFPNAESGKRIGCRQYHGFELAYLAASTEPKAQAVLVNLDGDVAVLGGGYNDMEEPIEQGADGPRRGGIFGLSTVAGHIYALSAWRGIARRLGTNQWESLCRKDALPEPSTGKGSIQYGTSWGFQAVDGFSESDLYAVGGKGDVWHYDGKVWAQCPLPTNMLLENVCCAGDGQVYIGAESGSVIRGRGNHWEVLHRGSMTIPFRDMVWFQDRVWCTSDYGVWQIIDGELVGADLPGMAAVCAGHLSVGDGVMLLGGLNGAALFDGQTWQRMIDPAIVDSVVP
ncbi:WD40/YVTN/BNR-like repeat-containing protein [Chitinimonas lacunae]|uniref:WD40/YVTN/BNR-like repeat-containing protein n=1 Tax=Chitinimonas lacunae TaxID=1963018 RepID=A0ABV8MXP2_9NEIS